MHKLVFFSLVASSFIACNKGDVSQPQMRNNEEQITTVQINAFKTDKPDSVFGIVWRDLDGFGGLDPKIDIMQLQANTNYQWHLVLLNESVSPVDTISNEILKEADVHRFFYLPDSAISSLVQIHILDKDNQSKPLGLNAAIQVSPLLNNLTSANGNIRIILSHYDGIPKSDLPAPESDMEIEFPVIIVR